MTKKERNIRHCLAFYGSGLRACHYGLPDGRGGYWAGSNPQRGYLSAAYAQVDGTGMVTDITLYTYGDVYDRKDIERGIDITDAVEGWLADRDGPSWDSLIEAISDSLA